MSRHLFIGDEERAMAAQVVAYAQAHPYRPAADPSPGDNPAHVLELGPYRAVFSITHSNGMVFRHLSVSVPGGLYPNVPAVQMIAEIFGFTGWEGLNTPPPADIQVRPDERVPCVVIAQPVASDVPKGELN